MTIPLDSRRTAKPCPFKAFRRPLTPAVSILARPSLNLRVFCRFPATGGRVPLVYAERERRVNLPRLLAVDCRLLAVCEFRATSSISFISPAYEHQPCISFVSPTYAKTGEYTPPKNVGAPTFLIFPLIFRTFPHLRPARLRRRPLHKLRAGWASPSPTKKMSHGSRDTGHDPRATSHKSPVTSSAIL
jgi:hypothetical protein